MSYVHADDRRGDVTSLRERLADEIGAHLEAGANPTLQRNRIHDGKTGGVFVYDNGHGLLEDNDIFGNALAGVEIKTGGSPVLHRNRVSKNGYEAVWE